MDTLSGPIAVFDSGYGGLTVLEKLRKRMPQYDFLYLGDNARSPYGTRSFDVVYEYTLEAVEKLFSMGVHLVILACNTASAKALRTIQQNDLPRIDPNRRVLGVIRPSVEVIPKYTLTNKIGVLGTLGTVQSDSYRMELEKQSKKLKVYQEACPMWVPLVENGEAESDGADFFIRKHVDRLLAMDKDIDTVILGCTHYPLLMNKIKQYLPHSCTILAQGDIVARSLEDYLKRHPQMDAQCSKSGETLFYTTENVDKFKQTAGYFLQEDIEVHHIQL
ncbi:glutamate racemase [Saccharicrinis fermentans]|uniref:Glutamate racemase n=1 Tax=Saccharicrinis fermentans DSM 9555 = JCM 21142 TaxID=869213 RepID=W7YRX7_9BACT|nr:glutamate racemase [Saccharicrinis fermentans]GAF05164.1 glutamate racemase [Saccharicrinis fermentans DSM 9555 = JCM 21142]